MKSRLALKSGITGTARISDCGLYRYILSRRWESLFSDDIIGWIMLNPSTATAETNDPTIRRCINFAKGWGCGGIDVVNLFSYRATRPADLEAKAADSFDVIGPSNDEAIMHMLLNRRIIIAAWGGHKIFEDRKRKVCKMASDIGVKLMCMGTTEDGSPKHPLYLPNDTVAIPYALRQ